MSTLPCRPFPLIDFNLEMEREVTGKSSGDYDPGRVKVRLSDSTMCSLAVSAADATREEVQRKAFEATEREIFPVSKFGSTSPRFAPRVKRRDSAEAFLPILQEAADNPWGEDIIPDEAGTALHRLEAATSRQ